MKLKLKFIIVLFFTGAILSSCTNLITYPSISKVPTNVHNPGQFVWHDLVTPNPKKAMEFYKDVFGWTFTTLGEADQAYYVISNNGKTIGGMYKLPAENGTVGEWVSSISVPDVSKAVSFNELKGGKTLINTMNVKGRGKSALVQDPQGAIISFIHSESGDPSEKDLSTWLWNELWTSDMDASVNFYKGLNPLQSEKVTKSNVPYIIFSDNGNKLSGAMKNPVEGMRTSWVPYININDVNSIVSKVKNAGGFVMMEPNADVHGGTVAVVQDPNGAVIATQEWK